MSIVGMQIDVRLKECRSKWKKQGKVLNLMNVMAIQSENQEEHVRINA